MLTPTIAVIGFSNVGYRTACRLAQDEIPVQFIVSQNDAFQITDTPSGLTVTTLAYLQPKDILPIVSNCTAAIVATENEQFNLHITMLLHHRFENMRIVTHFFNLAVGREIEAQLERVTVMSVSEQAAPFFAAAALRDDVVYAWREPKALKARIKVNDTTEIQTVTTEEQFWNAPNSLPRKPKKTRKSQPDQLFILVLGSLLLSIISGTFFFSWHHRFPIGDAFYFVITTITTTGYGDYSLKDFPFSAKLAGISLMLLGTTLFALLFALITDKLFSFRLEVLLGQRRVRKTGHIIICGAGDVGSRVLDCLVLAKADIVAIEVNPDGRFNHQIRGLGIPLLIADATLEETLERASIFGARTIICATDQDMLNLEIALNAKALNPKIRMVLRIFDQEFAEYMDKNFGFDIVLSSSSIASFAFAKAALGENFVQH